jgi:hypothetical protein
MSYITTMSKFVQLSDNNIGSVIIKKNQRNPNVSGYPIAYKVNMNWLIDKSKYEIINWCASSLWNHIE